MTSTWSDEESDRSPEEDNMVSNQVAFTSSLFLDNRVFVQSSAYFVPQHHKLLQQKASQLPATSVDPILKVEMSLKRTMNLYKRLMRRCARYFSCYLS